MKEKANANVTYSMAINLNFFSIKLLFTRFSEVYFDENGAYNHHLDILLQQAALKISVIQQKKHLLKNSVRFSRNGFKIFATLSISKYVTFDMKNMSLQWYV